MIIIMSFFDFIIIKIIILYFEMDMVNFILKIDHIIIFHVILFIFAIIFINTLI
jgi:hypothetical protein